MNPSELAAYAAAVVAAVVAFQVAAAQARLTRVERKLDRLLAKLGVDPHPPLSDRVKELAGEGRKIEAIKLYRDETGAGLAEAKAAVESFQASAGE
jgi:ribosomal protein L7/L12